VVDVPLVDYGDDLLVSTIPIRPSGALDREVGGMPKISEKIFALVDVFKSGYWEADSSHMYVDFAVAQQMAGMEGQPASDDKPAVPARASQIQIKVRDPAEAQQIVEKIGAVWREFVKARPEVGLLQLSINTWETQQRMILTVVEMERNITALMLGLMFVGFAVLIALISYVMAYIKSRDVGILKAVGAHDAGVGSLFLGYGFIIGVIGTVLGLGGALLMIYYLDPLEVWVNTTFDINIFPREMYYFEHIPRHISALWCVAVSGAVLVLATLASMAGGLLAALRQPVETLRYE
jgi:lipoprotein-releasing system permease protein